MSEEIQIYEKGQGWSTRDGDGSSKIVLNYSDFRKSVQVHYNSIDTVSKFTQFQADWKDTFESFSCCGRIGPVDLIALYISVFRKDLTDGLFEHLRRLDVSREDITLNVVSQFAGQFLQEVEDKAVLEEEELFENYQRSKDEGALGRCLEFFKDQEGTVDDFEKFLKLHKTVLQMFNQTFLEMLEDLPEEEVRPMVPAYLNVFPLVFLRRLQEFLFHLTSYTVGQVVAASLIVMKDEERKRRLEQYPLKDAIMKRYRIPSEDPELEDTYIVEIVDLSEGVLVDLEGTDLLNVEPISEAEFQGKQCSPMQEIFRDLEGLDFTIIESDNVKTNQDFEEVSSLPNNLEFDVEVGGEDQVSKEEQNDCEGLSQIQEDFEELKLVEESIEKENVVEAKEEHQGCKTSSLDQFLIEEAEAWEEVRLDLLALSEKSSEVSVEQQKNSDFGSTVDKGFLSETLVDVSVGSRDHGKTWLKERYENSQQNYQQKSVLFPFDPGSGRAW